MIGDTRGRLTIPDVLIGTFALAILGALWPVVAEGMDTATPEMTVGELYLARLLLPLMLLTLLAVVFAKATAGGQR